MSARWSSRFAFIMATTGAAVGLGNIWKFPYMAGDNGGSAFVVVYLLAVALVGLPAMLGEISLGRLGRANPIDTLAQLALRYQAHPQWRLVGWIGALSLLLILSFYSVVAGWSLGYLFKAVIGELDQVSPCVSTDLWQSFLNQPGQLLIWHSIFIFLTLWIVKQGVHKGLERASVWMMPALLLILIFLVGYSSLNGDMAAAAKFLFTPDFTKLTPQVLLNALGHACFSLAVGAGCLLVYGSYLPTHKPLIGNALIIVALNLLVALLAGLAIFPLVFAYHLPPEAGPGLMFKVLPVAFGQMPYGQLIGSLFFLLLFFAAWTSSISLAEPLVIIAIEKKTWSRNKAAIIVGIISWLLGVFALLSFNYSQNLLIFKRNLFECMVDLSTNLLLPLGGLGLVLFAGWKIPAQALSQGLQLKQKTILFKIIYALLRYITPLGIILILLTGLW